MIGDEFSEQKSYSTGERCIYKNTLWKFTDNKPAGAWDSTKVESTTVDAELAELQGEVDELNSRLQYTPFEITSENENAIFTAYTENGCVMIRVELVAGASGIIDFSVPPQYAPRTTVVGAYASSTTTADVGKLNGAYIPAGGAGSIWLNAPLSASENISFAYPLKS